MTRDEILAAARDAGALVFQSNFCNSSFDFTLENLERFAALVAAHEREACAKVCDELQNDAVAKYFDATAGECAAAIRERNNHG